MNGVTDLSNNLPGYIDDLRQNDTIREYDDRFNISENLKHQADQLPSKLADDCGCAWTAGSAARRHPARSARDACRGRCPLQALAERVAEIIEPGADRIPGRARARAQARDLLGPSERDRARGGRDRRRRPAHGRASGGLPCTRTRARLSIVCAGHHATETLGVRAACELLRERFGLEHVFLDVPNPVEEFRPRDLFSSFTSAALAVIRARR